LFGAYETAKPTTIPQLIWWWEWRRLVFNGILLVVLFATYVGILEVAGPHLPGGQDAIEPMAMVFFIIPQYFFYANLLYVLTWVVELSLRWFHVEMSDKVRVWVFWSIVLLASAITSLPFWWACIYWFGKPVIS